MVVSHGSLKIHRRAERWAHVWGRSQDGYVVVQHQHVDLEITKEISVDRIGES